MKKLATLLALTASITTVSLPSRAEDLQSIISGAKVPLTVKFQNLDSTWRQIAVSGVFEFGDLMRAYGSLFGVGSSSGIYYTKGETIEVYGKTYVIAYRIQSNTQNLSFQKIIESTVGTYGMNPDCNEENLSKKLLSADTSLVLSLLNVETIGSLNDIRTFDFKQEQAAAQQVYNEAKATCNKSQIDSTNTLVATHLSYLNQAIISYAGQNQDKLPKMTDASTVATELNSYIFDATYFYHPITQEAYQPNPSLSGKKLADIANASEIVSFYENTPAADGTIGVVYLDGNVTRIKAEEWAKVKATSGIR
jgi:hypothetical protein